MILKILLREIPEHPLFIITGALVVGLVFAQQTEFLSSYVSIFLSIIFFLGALKTDLREVAKYFHQVRKIALFVLISLLLLPMLVYFVVSPFSAEFAIAFMLLAAMPAGITTPILANIFGGRRSLAMVLMVVTSLLAVFTIPFLINLLVGTAVSVSLFDMFVDLAKIIFIPFILAEIAKHFWEGKIKKQIKFISPLPILFLGLAIVGMTAGQASLILEGLRGGLLLDVALLTVLFSAFVFIGYMLPLWRDKMDKLSVIVCFCYVNIALAIFLATEFFDDPKIITAVVLSEIPFVLSMVFFKYFAKKVVLRSE